jgi:hypothetical protein
MNILCDRRPDCDSNYLYRGPNTEEMARAGGWIIWRGTTMGGKDQEVILCDKCVEASRRGFRRNKYDTLPGQYPIPELRVLPGEK